MIGHPGIDPGAIDDGPAECGMPLGIDVAAGVAEQEVVHVEERLVVEIDEALDVGIFRALGGERLEGLGEGRACGLCQVLHLAGPDGGHRFLIASRHLLVVGIDGQLAEVVALAEEGGDDRLVGGSLARNLGRRGDGAARRPTPHIGSSSSRRR